MELTKAKQLLADLDDERGRRVADIVGVQRRSVIVKSLTQFPASWFVAIERLCEERGIECPIEAFTFKDPVIGTDGPVASEGAAE